MSAVNPSVAALQDTAALSSTPSSSTSTPTPVRKGPPKCHTGCGERAVKIVGTCRYCSANFCSRHRLPEAHACSNLQGCRDESIAKLEHKLIGEKCVASKV